MFQSTKMEPLTGDQLHSFNNNNNNGNNNNNNNNNLINNNYTYNYNSIIK